MSAAGRGSAGSGPGLAVEVARLFFDRQMSKVEIGSRLLPWAETPLAAVTANAAASRADPSALLRAVRTLTGVNRPRRMAHLPLRRGDGIAPSQTAARDWAPGDSTIPPVERSQHAKQRALSRGW